MRITPPVVIVKFLKRKLSFTVAASISVFMLSASIFTPFAKVLPINLSNNSCPTPPSTFNILKATDAELQFYGLPHPPAGSDQYRQEWATHIQPTLKSHICVNGIVSNQHHETQPQAKITASTYNYPNNIWEGFVATNGGFDYVFSDWRVPCYTSSKSPSKSSAVQWIGIGGYGTSNLWQAGTEADPSEGYRFWYEDVPNDSIIYYGPSVGCGDQVAVQVDYNYSFSNQSYVWMGNYTRDQYASLKKSFKPNTNSAEWIDERTTCQPWIGRTGPDQLADFNYTAWTYSWAQSTYYSNELEPISYYNNYELTMTDDGTWQGTYLAYNLGLGSGGNNFTDYWENNGTKQNDC